MNYTKQSSLHATKTKKVRSMNDPREWALYKGVWSLGKTERRRLDLCLYGKVALDTFMIYVDDNHDYNDFICFQKENYQIIYHDCGYHMLDQIDRDSEAGFTSSLSYIKELLVSVRRKECTGMRLVLIKPVLAHMDTSTYPEVIFGESHD